MLQPGFKLQTSGASTGGGLYAAVLESLPFSHRAAVVESFSSIGNAPQPRLSEEKPPTRQRRKSHAPPPLSAAPSAAAPPAPPLSAPPPGAKSICDIVRLMFVCDTLDDVATLLDLISRANTIEVVRFKDRIANPSGGWRDAMLNFTLPNSKHPDHICEVQIVHKKMAMCRQKDGLGGHDDYARERNAREILEFLRVDASQKVEVLALKDVQKALEEVHPEELAKALTEGLQRSREGSAPSRLSMSRLSRELSLRLSEPGEPVASKVRWTITKRVLGGTGALRRILPLGPKSGVEGSAQSGNN